MPPNVINLSEHLPPEHEHAVAKAIEWLSELHRKGWANAIAATLDAFSPEGALSLADFDADEARAILINASEWLLARGQINARGALRDINAYLLGPGGPRLSPGQARWIAQLREQPLRLYRITDVRPDEGLTLVDAIDQDAAPATVRERSASRSLRPGMTLGARLMPAGGHVELSGAIYVFAGLPAAQAIEAVSASLAGAGTPDEARSSAELTIARRWLAQFTEPPEMPELRDAASGDPLLLVTDHYRVLDGAALGAVLAAQPDVSASAAGGWTRDADAGGGMRRSLLAINPGRSADRIEVFARTQRLADDGRAWFEALAGAAVQHLTREVVDPRSPQALAAAADAPAGAPPGIGPDQLGELIAHSLRRMYANWADEPIPALGGRTPREAIATPGGLERVKGLLRQYEAGEAEQARAQQRAEFSFQFLWDALGIAR
jgi:hypothetical protein